jgi:hypothetical protein
VRSFCQLTLLLVMLATCGSPAGRAQRAIADDPPTAVDAQPKDDRDALDIADSPAADAEENTAGAAVTPPSIDDLAWEVRPYRVLVSLAFADRNVMSEAFITRTINSLSVLVDGEVGPYWQPTYQRNEWLFPQSAAALQTLTGENLTARFESTDYDKALVIVLESDGPGYVLSGCEWDRITHSRGPILRRNVVDRRRIPTLTFEMLTNLLRPIAEIELAEETFAELRVRGGELLHPDSPLFPFRQGDLLTGHFRYLDRDSVVRRIQDVPWSYFRIDGINRSRMTATIETPFTNPFSGARRRVELVAVKVTPAYPATEVALAPRTNPNKPLVGVRVRVYDELPSEENPQPEYVDLMTDRQGIVRVPADPDQPLRRLIVHSGGAVLSNVPYVPGMERNVSMQVPDDAPRLQVEGSLAMVQGDLIDIVSRRVVMLARAVSLARKEQFDEAEKLLAEVDAQPSVASFESRILAIRVPAVEKAQANRDRSQEKRIRMMCREVEELVRKHLDRRRVDDAKAEVRELKQIAGK